LSSNDPASSLFNSRLSSSSIRNCFDSDTSMPPRRAANDAKPTTVSSQLSRSF
jgi:hypothetical protein